MRVFMHRGANNVPLFKDAVDLGFRTFEGDVMLCRDGAVMVHPGADLPKRTPQGHLDYTVEEVQAIKRDGHEAIEAPHLMQMLGMIKEIDGHLLLETKIRYTIESLVALGYLPKDMREHLTIISFDGVELEGAHKAGFRTGLLLKHDPSPRGLEGLLRAYGFYALMPHEWYISPGTVSLVHELDLEVWPWTVNGHGRAAELRDMGVDAIQTDIPELVYDVKGLEIG